MLKNLASPLLFTLATFLGTWPLFAQVINPADYGNITLRLRAEELTLANQAPVSAWGPLGATGSLQPTFVASDVRFNNKAVMKLDGVDDAPDLNWSSP